MLMRTAGLALAATLAGGCAANKYCLDEQDYYGARTVPPLARAEGLNLPASPTALRIPPPPAESVPFGEKVEDVDGEKRVSCLDLPPPMPPLAAPAVAPAPEAAPAPATTPEAGKS